VIFNTTSNNTRTTAGTGVQINCHYPAVTWLLIFIPQIIGLMCVRKSTRLGVRILQVFRERCLANNISPFDRMVRLRLRQFVNTRGFTYRSFCSKLNRSIYETCKRICVHSYVIASLPDFGTSISDSYRYRTSRLPWL